MKTMEELSETFKEQYEEAITRIKGREGEYLKYLFKILNTLYSCKSCGGICQIKEDMVTDGQQAIARIKGREGEYLKECPYCKKQAVFRRIEERKETE